MSLFLIICRCLGSIAEGFRSVCKLKADLSGLRPSLSTYATSVGRPYWRIDFEIEIFFGQTTLCANLVWKEDVRTLFLAIELQTKRILMSIAGPCSQGAFYYSSKWGKRLIHVAGPSVCGS